MHRVFYCCVVSVLMSGVAHAEDRVNLPSYDPDTICSTAFNNPGVWMEEGVKIHFINECIRREQSSYNYLKSIWYVVSNESEKICIENNASLPKLFVRYSMLDRCIDNKHRQEQRREYKIERFKP